MPDFIHESNIFGETTQTSSAPPPEPASAATTIAGKLIDHLKYVADSNVLLAENKADWLAIASITGQNDGSNSIMRKPLKEPDRIASGALVSGWNLPQLPALLSLPALPSDLQVDIDKIKNTWQPDLDALQKSWMAQYLPAVTDVSALNALFTHVLDGSAATSFEARLNALETATTAALSAITGGALTTLNTLAAAMQSALTTNITTQQGNISAALALAQDNTQEIAWTRARDQVAREGKRLEDEAVTTFASRGFSLPAGILASQLAHQRQATLSAASDMAAQEALRIQQAFLEIAKTTVDAWQRTMELQNRAQIDQFRVVTDATLKGSELQLDANKYNAELAVKHLGLTLDITKFAAEEAVKYRLGVIEGMNGLIHSYAQLRGIQVEYVRNVAAAKAQMMTALVEYYRAAISSVEVGLRVEMANNENAMRYIQAAGEIIGTAVRNHVQAASASADVFARVAATALSGLNAVAQQTSNG